MTTTVNEQALIDAQNRTFVRGTVIGRKAIARALTRIFNFKGGYRAAYQVAGGKASLGPAHCGVYVFKHDNTWCMNAMYDE